MAAKNKIPQWKCLKEGMILVAKSLPYMYDTVFYRVTGFTKTGNPRIERLKSRIVKTTSTPAQSETVVEPTDQASDLSERTTLRWSEKEKYAKVIGMKYVVFFPDALYDPRTTYTIEHYG